MNPNFEPNQQDLDGVKYQKHHRFQHRINKSKRQLRTLISAWKSHNGAKILDIGCAGGYTIIAAKNLEMDAFGVDIWHSAIQFCQDQGLNVKFGDIQNLPFENDFFDYIIMKHVLEHHINISKSIKEVHRVLKPGGKIYIAVPDSNYWKSKYKYNRLDQLRAGHYVHFTMETMVKFLKKNGFTTTIKGRSGWNPLSKTDCVKTKKLNFIIEILRQIFFAIPYRFIMKLGLRREFIVVAKKI